MRVAAYIDGYNLYHAINDLSEIRDSNGHISERRDKHFLKWLDLRRLVEKYCDLSSQTIQSIYYFSADPVHMGDSRRNRHALYIRALKHREIQYVEGRFKRTGKKWIKRSDGVFVSNDAHEEKESDVNMAIHIVRDAICGTTDKAIIITNDSDISPAIRLARKMNPQWKAAVLTPPLSHERHVNYDLLSAAGLFKRDSSARTYREVKIISEARLIECQLPDQIVTETGGLIRRPGKYTVPSEYR